MVRSKSNSKPTRGTWRRLERTKLNMKEGMCRRFHSGLRLGSVWAEQVQLTCRIYVINLWFIFVPDRYYLLFKFRDCVPRHVIFVVIGWMCLPWCTGYATLYHLQQKKRNLYMPRVISHSTSTSALTDMSLTNVRVFLMTRTLQPLKFSGRLTEIFHNRFHYH
jgi:hypothetical protein